MTKDEIQEKFPQWEVIYEPNPDCKWCHGTGVKKTANKDHPERPCVCTCIMHEFADIAQEAFNRMAQENRLVHTSGRIVGKTRVSRPKKTVKPSKVLRFV
ncbi:MAG: hypothetical protein WC479_00760 [Candidatus Izemoplasmatales bacterium]